MVIVETWENDADNYAKQVFDGLTWLEAEFYVCLASLFRPEWKNNSAQSYGNEENNYALELDAIIKTQAKCPFAFEDSSAKDLTHLIHDIIGTWNDGDFYRVVDNIQVYYLESSLEDLYSQFVSQ